MKITIREKGQGPVLRKLHPGDCFVRNAAPRPLDGRSVYMVLWEHTRLEPFCRGALQIPVVALHTGRISALKKEQAVLKVNGGVEMEIVE